MGLLRKAYKKLKNLSRGKSACKTLVPPQGLAAGDSDPSTYGDAATTIRGLEQAAVSDSCRVRPTGNCWTTGCFARDPVVNVTELGSSCELGMGGGDELLPSAAAADVQMLSPARGVEPAGARNLSSESDSGVCLSEVELQREDEFAAYTDNEDFEDEYECECEECAFAKCEHVLEDWHISAKELALDKVLSRQPGETVYRYATM